MSLPRGADGKEPAMLRNTTIRYYSFIASRFAGRYFSLPFRYRR